jgi:FUSC-like inner membrane protein yccS
MPERAAVAEAMAQAHSVIDAVRTSRAGMSLTGQGLLVLLRHASSIFDAAIALAETLEAVSHQPQYALVRAEIEDAVQQLAAAVTELATAIMQGHDRVDLRALEQAAAAMADKMTGLQGVPQAPAKDFAALASLQTTMRALQAATKEVHTAVDVLARHSGMQLTERPPSVGRQPSRDRLGVVSSMLTDNFTIRSLTFRHALRLGITAMAAVALYTVFDLPHGGWVTLTAMVVLKPNFGGTYQLAELGARTPARATGSNDRHQSGLLRGRHREVSRTDRQPRLAPIEACPGPIRECQRGSSLPTITERARSAAWPYGADLRVGDLQSALLRWSDDPGGQLARRQWSGCPPKPCSLHQTDG